MSRSVEQRWQRAQGYLANAQAAPARAELEMMRAQAPQDVRAHVLASQIAWRDGRVRAATQAALEACAAAPADLGVACAVVEALLQVGEVVAARDMLAGPALTHAGQPTWLLRQAAFRQQLNENDAALALVERAIAAAVTEPDTAFHHGALLYFHGRIAAATTALDACLDVAPANGRAAYMLASLRTQTEAVNHLARIDAGIRQVARGSRDHAALEFARYKELEDLGRFDEAWVALATGNAVMHARTPYSVDRDVGFLHRLADALPKLSASHAVDGSAGPQPIFILGPARSGTTVLERMLGNHPQVESAGELVDFGAQLQWVLDTQNTHCDAYLAQLAALDFSTLGRRYLAQTSWRAHGKPFFIDKQPPNWEMAGLIHAALPHAKILHLVRDPMDVCFSNWRAFFGDTYGFSYDLATLGAWHRAYRRVIAGWHALLPGTIMDVDYADLVRDPEATMCKVFDHCGLARVTGCSDMRRNAVPVATLSAAQVREPLRDHGGAWRRYARYLNSLRAALEQA